MSIKTVCCNSVKESKENRILFRQHEWKQTNLGTCIWILTASVPKWTKENHLLQQYWTDALSPPSVQFIAQRQLMVNLPTARNPIPKSHFADRGLESAPREAASYRTKLLQLTWDGTRRDFALVLVVEYGFNTEYLYSWPTCLFARLINVPYLYCKTGRHDNQVFLQCFLEVFINLIWKTRK